MYSDVSKQFVLTTISFSFKEDAFPPLSNVWQLIKGYFRALCYYRKIVAKAQS